MFHLSVYKWAGAWGIKFPLVIFQFFQFFHYLHHIPHPYILWSNLYRPNHIITLLLNPEISLFHDLLTMLSRFVCIMRFSRLLFFFSSLVFLQPLTHIVFYPQISTGLEMYTSSI